MAVAARLFWFAPTEVVERRFKKRSRRKSNRRSKKKRSRGS
jgi:hypothetical protein